MERIFENKGIRIKLYLNKDESVDTSRIMHIEFKDSEGEIETIEAYPDKDGKVATVAHQFEYAQAILKFNITYNRVFLNKIRIFLEERPLISPSGLSKEAGFDPRYLPLILAGERNLTENVINKLKPILEKYGFK